MGEWTRRRERPDAERESSPPACPSGSDRMRAMTGPRGEGPGYREHRPAPDLAPWIECFWTRGPERDARTAAQAYRILPDGCADILFDLSGRVDAFVVGPMTRALVLAPGPRD